MSRLFKYYGISVKKGEYIFREGDDATCLFMIHQGKIQIQRKAGDSVKKLQVLSDGEFLGEMAIISSMPRSADAVAMEDSKLIRMERESFEKTIRENNQFALSVIRSLTQRLREADESIAHLAASSRTNRFFSEVLLEILNSGKRDSSGKWHLISKDYLYEKFEKRYREDKDIIYSSVEKLEQEGIISFKKDGSGKEWVAIQSDMLS